MEQNREPRNKLTHFWTINPLIKEKEQTVKMTVSSQSDAGKTHQLHVKQ